MGAETWRAEQKGGSLVPAQPRAVYDTAGDRGGETNYRALISLMLLKGKGAAGVG